MSDYMCQKKSKYSNKMPVSKYKRTPMKFTGRKRKRTAQSAFRAKRAKNIKFGMTKSLNYKGVYFHKEKCTKTIPMTLGAGTQTSCILLNFKLSDLNNSAVFSSLWDYYMITGVKITAYPMNASVPVVNAAGALGSQYFTTQIAMKQDLDGGVPWANWAQALEANAKVRQFTGDYPISTYVKPKLTYRAAEQPGVAPQNVITIPTGNRQNWVDIRYDDAEYNGLQLAIHHPPNSPTDTADLQLVFSFYVAFKGKL